ncbi:MAG: hypothetical protein E5V49_17765 [Mesorhizobium sp.]|nr:hypothetical protein EN829_013130 [Mesorhizobium sp. M00.F.Ca.ET.186.01.1.1]TGZ43198.1 hypothetical protein EN805_08710 [bacterium M00.F.Ca.ET.162.01.1.1]TIW59862.1 MAG: hypothetical protein E5V48_16150 [Mesorhizobium sp.]TJW31143.1 MAG: hypothetical protein E5V49_17765 [Mesorhizobium sp.]
MSRYDLTDFEWHMIEPLLPAIIGKGDAYAMLEPNSPWVRVGAASVGSDGDLLDEDERLANIENPTEG